MPDVLWDAAVLLSAHGPHLIERQIRVPDDVQHRYWSLSQARLRIWRKAIRSWMEAPAENSELLQQTVNAVFTGDVLMRLAGTLMDASDLRRKVNSAAPIARNVLLGHLEVRRSLLELLLDGRGLPAEMLSASDTLRRRSERWTDVLIGQLVVRYGAGSYAFDLERARDFGSEQLRTATQAAGHQQVWDLYRLSLRSAFEPYSEFSDQEHQFRQSLCSVLLGWLPPELFSDTGLIESPWVLRFLRLMHSPDRQDATGQRSSRAVGDRFTVAPEET